MYYSCQFIDHFHSLDYEFVNDNIFPVLNFWCIGGDQQMPVEYMNEEALKVSEDS